MVINLNYIAFILAVVSCFLSYKALKLNKLARSSVQPECKSVVNQRVLSAVKEFDKKGKQLVYCVVRFDGDELDHVLVNLQDFSVISPSDDIPGT